MPAVPYASFLFARNTRFDRQENIQEVIQMAKKLVAYFSASGTTKKIAEMIAEAGNADLCEITPKVAYTKADLNWMEKNPEAA